jgi:hypothetical protein
MDGLEVLSDKKNCFFVDLFVRVSNKGIHSATICRNLNKSLIFVLNGDGEKVLRIRDVFIPDPNIFSSRMPDPMGTIEKRNMMKMKNYPHQKCVVSEIWDPEKSHTISRPRSRG